MLMQILNERLIGYLNWLFVCNWQYIFISSISDAKCYKYMFSCFYIILFLLHFYGIKEKIIIAILTILVFNDIVHSTSATIYISYSTF